VYVAPLSTVRVYGTCLGEPSQPRMSESGHLYPPLEMDSLPAQSPVMIGKSHVSQKLARRDYAIGICLLLLVVFLWTTSNFVTQDIFVGGYEKPFLITYLTTSTFSLYLLPFLIKSYIRRRYHGGSNQTVELGTSDEYEPLVNEDETPPSTV